MMNITRKASAFEYIKCLCCKIVSKWYPINIDLFENSIKKKVYHKYRMLLYDQALQTTNY